MSFSVKVFQLKVSSHRCIPKPSVSCSAAVHHCHPFHLLFSPFSAPSLSSLASVSEWCLSARRQTSREWLQPLLLCVLFYSFPSSIPRRTAEEEAPLRLLCSALQDTAAVVWHEAHAAAFCRKRGLFFSSSLCDEVNQLHDSTKGKEKSLCRFNSSLIFSTKIALLLFLDLRK